VSKVAEIKPVLVGSNENHPLSKANASVRGDLGSDAETGPFTAVEKVATTRGNATDSLGVGFF
jgi:hypothetical protein